MKYILLLRKSIVLNNLLYTRTYNYSLSLACPTILIPRLKWHIPTISVGAFSFNFFCIFLALLICVFFGMTYLVESGTHLRILDHADVSQE